MGSRTKKTTPLAPEALALIARRFRILGEPTRLALLQELFAGELTVTDLCERTGTSQANVSKHLATLTAEGILARRKDGLYVHYRIVDATVRQLCDVVCGSLAERFERAGEHFSSR